MYLYAPFVPKDLDLETLLKAGTLLYYREGAAATVSVKRLTGTTTLAVDGKIDASNRGDMLTQKLVAHLPLLLHDHPREVGDHRARQRRHAWRSALRHPIARVDVIEISPEVVEASRYFATENRHALDDPRTNLIVGDGRSHLLLTDRASTTSSSRSRRTPGLPASPRSSRASSSRRRRARLAPGGIICQWANAYNISDRRSPLDRRDVPVGVSRRHGLAGRRGRCAARGLHRAARRRDWRTSSAHWSRPGVAEDLRDVSALEPFSLWSLFVGGPDELARYGRSATLLTDDRMTLEFSGPRELHGPSAGENGATLAALLGPGGGPPIVRQAKASAGAAEWRNRAAMMARRDAHATAYDDYVRALTLDPADDAALDGLVRTAMLTQRGSDALSWVKSLNANRTGTPQVLIATSKLLAAIGASSDAVAAARQAMAIRPVQPEALEQLASLFADAGETTELDALVASMRTIAPHARRHALLRGRRRVPARQAASRRCEHARRADRDRCQPMRRSTISSARRIRSWGRRRRRARRLKPRSASTRTTAPAYTNLGLLELAAGNKPAAARYFAEALWLAPESATAREGLAQAR